MANPQHVALILKGAAEWNRWRTDNATIQPDLIKANLCEAHLAGTNLTGSDLSGAHLIEVDLYKADLREANLSGAHLSRAILGRAILGGAHLGGADLSGADVSQSIVGGTIFADLDLSTVQGLETVQHWEPSTIGIDTIYNSKGQIPEIFLRGAGVPEPFIVQMKALVAAMEPIQYYSCFISYSFADQEFAERLHADLQARGVRTWFAPHDIHAGKKLHEQIDEAIRVHDKLLLVLSPQSMASEWVATEIAKARKREVRDGKRVLFPLNLASFAQLRLGAIRR
jgi:hypothetical protein